ncbi:PUA-like domain-containing protein [Mycena maculata]|uniref:PUA-like domain-containing protein n=1 Tax=Mycena maculata TaxID=230809 RepID=A0AAD7NBI3_9AGAR|nr:PUA-like domain-containing protein [Mycena maculata]
METENGPNYWLLKAEPDSRIVKGKDVKFSVDDFESVKTSAWEGVRNYEARNLMKEMKLGEKALFYHSNCKAPGIAAFAEVSKEAYPDNTAWDSSHPYYDPKTKEADPKWYMVDLTFGSRAKHFVPLALLRFIADTSANSPPAGLEYLGNDGVAAIKEMDLVIRGRLSVQRVSAGAWAAIQLLASNGGWDNLDLAPKKKGTPKKAAADSGVASRPARAAKTKAKAKKRKAKNSDSEDEDDEDYDSEEVIQKTTSSRRKRKAEDYEELPPTRRANRAKTSS